MDIYQTILWTLCLLLKGNAVQAYASFTGQCVVDSANRLLPHMQNVGQTNSVDSCNDFCISNGFPFMGVQATTWCHCGYTAPPVSSYAPDSECNHRCPGDSNQICGAGWRMNVYNTWVPNRHGCHIPVSGYNYHYFPLNSKKFGFRAKADTDVHVALAPNDSDSDLYEIVIGGWENTKSVVRRGKQGPSLSEGTLSQSGSYGLTNTPGIVSPTEFRGFWITTDVTNNQIVIKVGKDGESAPFMTGVDENPMKIRYVGLSTWTGEDATFHISCTPQRHISDAVFQKSEVKKIADYDNLCYTCSVTLVSVDGRLQKYDTYETGYIQAAIKITKNFSGPKIEYLVESGLMKINAEGTPFESVDFSVFGAEASGSLTNTGAGFQAKLVLAGGSASIFDLQLGAGVSSQIGVVDDSATVKLLGFGVQIGRKIGICALDNCFAVDFGRLFG